MRVDPIDYVRNMKPQYKYTLGSAFVMGVLSQGMGLFNKYSVHDDAMNYGVGATYSSGRWMLDILEKAERIVYGDGHYSLPAFNGILSICLIALSACLLVRMLDIKSLFLSVFVSGLMVSFPVITSIFGYMFTLHFYMLVLLLGMLGAYLVCEYEKWYYWAIGVLLMGASAGIYQAFIPVIVTVQLFQCINYGIKDNNTFGYIKRLVRTAAGCVLFLVLYFGINRLYLSIQHAELTDYMGIASMGRESIREYCRRVIDAYSEFLVPHKEAVYFMYPGTILYIYYLALGISIAFCIYSIVKLFKRSIIRALIVTVLILLVPLSVNLIFVMVNRLTVHSLMVYAQLLPFVFFAWTVDNIRFQNVARERVVSSGAAVLMTALLVMYSRVDNKCYIKATYAQQEAISYFTSLVTQIKSADGYKDELPVAFVNEMHASDTSLQMGDYGAYDSIGYVPYILDPLDYLNNYRWMLFMKQWTGFSPQAADAKLFQDMEEVQQMPSYPDDGSIRIIGDTVVVKF